MAIMETLAAVGGANLIGGILNNDAASDRQEDSQGFSAEQYAKRYQTTVQDMQAAGLNPMLAYSQGVGNSPQSTPISGNPFSSTMGTDAAQALSHLGSANQAESNVKLIDETVNKVKSETSNIQENTKQLTQMILNLEAQRQNLIKDGYNITEQGNVLRETVRKINAEVPQIAALMRSQSSDSVWKDALSKVLGFDIEAAETSNNAGRVLNEYRLVIETLRDFIPSRIFSRVFSTVKKVP